MSWHEQSTLERQEAWQLSSSFLEAVSSGFALINWMSRRNRIGGIYARPLAMGNLLLFATAALTLGKKASAAENLSAAGIGICVLLAVMAGSFAWLVFAHDPVSDVPTNAV